MRNFEKIYRLDVYRNVETNEEVTVTIVSRHRVKVEGPTTVKTYGFTDFKKKYIFVRGGNG